MGNKVGGCNYPLKVALIPLK